MLEVSRRALAAGAADAAAELEDVDVLAALEGAGDDLGAPGGLAGAARAGPGGRARREAHGEVFMDPMVHPSGDVARLILSVADG